MYAAVLFSTRTLEQRIVAIPVWQFDFTDRKKNQYLKKSIYHDEFSGWHYH